MPRSYIGKGVLQVSLCERSGKLWSNPSTRKPTDTTKAFFSMNYMYLPSITSTLSL
jgi:hypothetical protein